jgi:putative membrane protein
MAGVIYGALLALGLALLFVTTVRTLTGGLVDSSRRRGGHGSAPAEGRARRILDERYAAGELSTDEYRHRRGILEEGT